MRCPLQGSTFSGSGRILPRWCDVAHDEELQLANFVHIPVQRVPPETLQALLEEFVSRDGTDYGEQETSLEQRVVALERQLRNGAARLLYDADSETWDILPLEAASELLEETPPDEH